jgi:acyl carrier protein
MTTEADRAAVRTILETALRTPLGSIENPSRAELDSWDSLVHLEIMFMIEEQFETRFSEDEIVALSSEDAILSALRAKHAA